MSAGDLFLEVNFRPHPLFTVDGRDVTVNLPVAPWEAALGETVSVPTLGGPVEMKLPVGARSGQRLRLRRAPELQFTFDETIGHQDRVEQLLKEIAEEQGSTPIEPGPDSPEPDEH